MRTRTAAPAGPRVGLEPALRLRGGGDRRAGPREDEEHPVALRVDLPAAALRERLPQDPAVVGERAAPPLPQCAEESRGAFDVREEERDGPAGKAAHGLQSPVAPSQQPSFRRQRAHCHVPWRHSISAPQRGQISFAAIGEAYG
jgi:hypothetical protein